MPKKTRLKLVAVSGSRLTEPKAKRPTPTSLVNQISDKYDHRKTTKKVTSSGRPSRPVSAVQLLSITRQRTRQIETAEKKLARAKKKNEDFLLQQSILNACQLALDRKLWKRFCNLRVWTKIGSRPEHNDPARAFFYVYFLVLHTSKCPDALEKAAGYEMSMQTAVNQISRLKTANTDSEPGNKIAGRMRSKPKRLLRLHPKLLKSPA